MRKFEWDWVSENALDAYKLILIYCNGGFAASEQLSLLIELADEIVRLEGRVPDSFRVAVDLGAIYSAAAVSNARAARVSDEFIAKASDAWGIASTHLEIGKPRDAALVEPGPLRVTYFGGYLQIACEIGFARYLQTKCTDVSHLRALKEYWVGAKQERPDNPILLEIGEQIDKKLGSEEHTERLEEQPAAVLPIGQSALEPTRQVPRLRLWIGAVVSVLAMLTGLAYVYGPIEGVREPQHGAPAGSLQTPPDRGIPILPETVVAAPTVYPEAKKSSGDKEPETISYAEESIEQKPPAQEPLKQHKQGADLLRSTPARQQPEATRDKVAETTAQNRASTTRASAQQPGSRDTKKAAQLEQQGLQALVAGDFTQAQRLFQASENAAAGFHYSYEWATLLRTRQAELKTPRGRRAVLQFALSKGYASHAPNDIRNKLRQLAE